ncbi:MAG: LacI family DNA-binding transcriptional regulator [Candidatus Methylomirabilota bacterium]|jgi:transposase
MLQSVARPVRVNRQYIVMAMAAHQVSCREIAQAAAVHPSTVTRVLRNFRSVAPEKRTAVIVALAKRLGVDPDVLCVGRLAA